MTASLSDTDIFEEIMEVSDIKPQCDHDICDKDAELIIKCGYEDTCKTFEFSCNECYLSLTILNAQLVFNDQCGHYVSIHQCSVQPI